MLFAALAIFFGLFVLWGLPRLHHPVFEVEAFRSRLRRRALALGGGRAPAPPTACRASSRELGAPQRRDRGGRPRDPRAAPPSWPPCRAPPGRLPGPGPHAAAAEVQGLPAERVPRRRPGHADPAGRHRAARHAGRPGARRRAWAPTASRWRSSPGPAHAEACWPAGRKRFDVHCAVCHGLLGDGESQVALNMSLRKPPNLHLYRDVAGRLPVPGRQPRASASCPATPASSPPRSAGAVVAYVRALQLSQHAAGGRAAAGGPLQSSRGRSHERHPVPGRRPGPRHRRRGGRRRPRPDRARGARRPAPGPGRLPGGLRLLARHRARRPHPAGRASTPPRPAGRWCCAASWRPSRSPSRSSRCSSSPSPWGCATSSSGSTRAASPASCSTPSSTSAPTSTSAVLPGARRLYFAVWIGVAALLRRWSVRQDQAGGHALTAAQRRLGTGALPFLALTLTFASFDWMMSLDPRFYSTIFGVYWFAGSFLGGLRGAGAGRQRHPGRPGPVRRPPQRRPRPLPRQVPARLHRLLGLHRLLPVHAHLDRQHPRGGALVRGPHRLALGPGGHLPGGGPLRHPLRRCCSRGTSSATSAGWPGWPAGCSWSTTSTSTG